MTTHPAAVVRAWLLTGPVAEATSSRVSTMFEPAAGLPALHIGQVSTRAGVTAQMNVDTIESWQVALYVHGGRLAAGSSDLPDELAAWGVVSAIVSACRALDGAHYIHISGARLVAAQIVSAVPGVDPDTNEARATVTLDLSVWDPQQP